MGVWSIQARILSSIRGVLRKNTPSPSVFPTIRICPTGCGLACEAVGDWVGAPAVGEEVGMGVPVGGGVPVAGLLGDGIELGCWADGNGATTAPLSAMPLGAVAVGALSANLAGEVGRGLGVTVDRSATAPESGSLVAFPIATTAPANSIAKMSKNGAAFTAAAILSRVKATREE